MHAYIHIFKKSPIPVIFIFFGIATKVVWNFLDQNKINTMFIKRSAVN